MKLKVSIITKESTIEHTFVDRVVEHGSFLCVYEDDIVYKYNISYILYLIESIEKVPQPK